MGNKIAIAVAVFIPIFGELIVIFGMEVYPLPFDIISNSVIDPPLIFATAWAVTPQSVLGSPIVTVGVEVYPVPPDPTITLDTV